MIMDSSQKTQAMELARCQSPMRKGSHQKHLVCSVHYRPMLCQQADRQHDQRVKRHPR